MYLMTDHDVEHFGGGTFWRLMNVVLKERRGSSKNWGTGTTQHHEKKNSIYPILNTKNILVTEKLHKYTGYWEIALFGELPK